LARPSSKVYIKRKGRRCRVSSTLKSTIRRKHFLSLGYHEEKAMTLHDGQLDVNLALIVNRKEIATVGAEKACYTYY
jgi:hypothetical protein